MVADQELPRDGWLGSSLPLRGKSDSLLLIPYFTSQYLRTHSYLPFMKEQILHTQESHSWLEMGQFPQLRLFVIVKLSVPDRCRRDTNLCVNNEKRKATSVLHECGLGAVRKSLGLSFPTTTTSAVQLLIAPFPLGSSIKARTVAMG